PEPSPLRARLCQPGTALRRLAQPAENGGIGTADWYPKNTGNLRGRGTRASENCARLRGSSRSPPGFNEAEAHVPRKIGPAPRVAESSEGFNEAEAHVPRKIFSRRSIRSRMPCFN